MSDSAPIDCPFCHLPPERILVGNTHAVAIADAYPVSPGHTLIILRRHTATFFGLTAEELADLYDLLQHMKGRLDSSHQPAGYNIGVNDGVTAGQMVMHLHVHLIPRFAGDVADPRGGVRNVRPGKGNYG